MGDRQSVTLFAVVRSNPNCCNKGLGWRLCVLKCAVTLTAVIKGWVKTMCAEVRSDPNCCNKGLR